MKKVLVILGPTATGKTDWALYLAKKFRGELLACDSRQVYQGLDIGTGKLPGGKYFLSSVKKADGWWEIDGVKVWMYDVVDLRKQYTVADYVRDATRAVDQIIQDEKLPIIVGGTGLYLRGLLEGLSNLSIPVDETLRKTLQRLPLNKLQEKLQLLSIDKWEKMNQSDKQNPRRLIRAVELVSMDSLMMDRRKQAEMSKTVTNVVRKKYDVLKIGLSAPRNVLYKKINDRVVGWINEGIVDEVQNLLKKGINRRRFKELGLEYAVIADYLAGEISDDRLVLQMQIRVRQYAKRQITWFKKKRDVCWFDIAEDGFSEKLESMVAKWYDSTIETTCQERLIYHIKLLFLLPFLLLVFGHFI